jgi:hypothetical protein
MILQKRQDARDLETVDYVEYESKHAKYFVAMVQDVSRMSTLKLKMVCLAINYFHRDRGVP